MLERMAFWVVLLQMPVYIAQKDAPGGLHWEQTIKGVIYLWWALVQNFTPIFSGGFADRYGYKRVMAVSFLISITGFILLGTQREFFPFLLGTLVLGLGLGIFKPVLQGSIARTLDGKNASLGWSINVMMINIAVFLGVPLSVFLKDIDWLAVFLGSAAIIALNYLMLFFYKDFERIESAVKNPLKILKTTFANLANSRLLIFVFLMSGFTMTYMQFYETLPNFIIDWVNTTDLVQFFNLPDFMTRQTSSGTMAAWEWFYNINTGLIIIAVVAVNRLFFRLKSTAAITIGIFTAVAGFTLSGISTAGWFLAAGIIIYTIGEMTTNPRFNEFMGKIAPAKDKALYMSYLNISWAFGLAGGSLLGGWLYKAFGEKSGLAMKYISENFKISEKITHSNSIAKLQELTGLNPEAAAKLLWVTYDPWILFIPFIVLGIISAIGMYFYSKYADQ